jgi:hypothetical protein
MSTIYEHFHPETMTLKIGDFVKVGPLTNQDGIPPSRMGHIVEQVRALPHYSSKEAEDTNVWKVYLTNGKILQFHAMFLERIEE